MKSKLRNLLLAAMAVTLFAGCSNIALNDASVESSESSDKCVLTISVDGFTGNNESSAGRTISPVAYKKEGNSLNFKIEGKSARNIKYDLAEIDLSSGTGKISLDYDVWYLTLHAYEGTGTDAKEVLQGETRVDLKKTVPEIGFVLSTKGITTPGSMKLTVTGFTDVIKSYKAGIYDVNTDALIGDLLINKDYEEDATTHELIVPTSEEITKNALNPGSYIFKFFYYTEFMPAAGTADTREPLGVCSDVITIAPGRETTAAFPITGVLTKPEAPTDFTVVLVDNSEADKDEYYTVRLNWKDNSLNEENFVLRIYEADGTETDDDTTDPAITEPKTALQKILVDGKKVAEFNKTNAFVGSDYYVSKTLGMSTETCDVKLRTGRLYEMTLAASNRAGESAVVTRSASSNGTNTTGFAITKSTTTTDAGGNEVTTTNHVTVNRQKITFDLLGGELKETAASAATTDNVVKYVTYDGAAKALSDIFGTYASLKYYDRDFKKWTSFARAGSPVTSTAGAVNGYRDLVVYASYDNEATVNYDITNEYHDLVTSVSLVSSAGAATISGVTWTDTTNTLLIDTTVDPAPQNDTANKIKFTIDGYKHVADDGTVSTVTIPATAVTKTTLYVDGNPVGIKDGLFYEYSLASFIDEGKYMITVSGQVDDKTYSAEPIEMNVKFKVD